MMVYSLYQPLPSLYTEKNLFHCHRMHSDTTRLNQWEVDISQLIAVQYVGIPRFDGRLTSKNTDD